jgi:hypothetical protein
MADSIAHQQPDRTTALFRAIRVGLESLTVTGPSMILNSLHRETLEAIARRPTQQEREAAISRAWVASSTALQLLRTGESSAAAQSVDQMYAEWRLAITASRPASS